MYSLNAEFILRAVFIFKKLLISFNFKLKSFKLKKKNNLNTTVKKTHAKSVSNQLTQIQISTARYFPSPETSPSRSKRSMLGFHTAIKCYNLNVNVLASYATYGCFCGPSGEGIPIDETDKFVIKRFKKLLANFQEI